MVEKSARVVNGKIGLSVLPDGISADKIVDGTTNKTITNLEKNKIANSALISSVEGLINHDGTAGGGTRPAGYYRVRWIGGTSRPTNMATGDIWERDA